MTVYYIYRTDGTVFMGYDVKPQWRNIRTATGVDMLTFDDPREARTVAAQLRAKGHDCDVEEQIVDSL